VVLVVAIVGGVGLGHVVWPPQTTTASALSPSSGSSGSGSSSSSGGSDTDPFGGGSSSGTSPYGSGSNGSSSTGAGAPSDISAIAAKVDPALVDINTNLSYEDEQAAGTGMVLTSNGEILTNNHVIDGATSISVTDVGNGKTYTGKVVGYDRTGDVAVVQLTGASGLQTVSTNGSVSVGEAVVGVGNAGGTGGTPSTAGGSIVALNQSITASDDTGGNSESLTGLIETNAGIQAGDSGGSLVNASGQVLGMDTAASTNNEDSGTQAYSIPITTALSIAKEIDAGKSSSSIHIGATGFLGVSVESSGGSGDSGGGSGFGGGGSGFGGGGSGFGGSSSGSGSSTTTGAAVEGTLPGSPAAKAGLVEGDVITAVNGSSVSSATDLSNLLEPYHPGDTVQLQWTDQSGQTHTASVQLEPGPPA
jgi:S1-C subfamily serine protease